MVGDLAKVEIQGRCAQEVVEAQAIDDDDEDLAKEQESDDDVDETNGTESPAAGGFVRAVEAATRVVRTSSSSSMAIWSGV